MVLFFIHSLIQFFLFVLPTCFTIMLSVLSFCCYCCSDINFLCWDDLFFSLSLSISISVSLLCFINHSQFTINLNGKMSCFYVFAILFFACFFFFFSFVCPFNRTNYSCVNSKYFFLLLGGPNLKYYIKIPYLYWICICFDANKLTNTYVARHLMYHTNTVHART